MKVHNYPSDVTREQFEIIRTEKAGSSGECCLLKKLVEVERKWQDRETFPTLATIKNTDTANKVSRIKLHRYTWLTIGNAPENSGQIG